MRARNDGVDAVPYPAPLPSSLFQCVASNDNTALTPTLLLPPTRISVSISFLAVCVRSLLTHVGPSLSDTASPRFSNPKYPKYPNPNPFYCVLSCSASSSFYLSISLFPTRFHRDSTPSIARVVDATPQVAPRLHDRIHWQRSNALPVDYMQCNAMQSYGREATPCQWTTCNAMQCNPMDCVAVSATRPFLSLPQSRDLR